MSFLKNSRNYMLFMLTALCSQVFGHTYLSSVYLNNQLLNEGDCVRPHPSTAFDSPIPLVTSPDMTCGWLPSAARPANRKCPVSAGSTIGIQWHHNSNSASDDIIEATHKGPVMVYLAKSDSGAGDVWFKIYEDGYANGRWGVDRLLDAKGRVDVTIPADIAPGNYLLRGEVIALHSAYDLNGVQPYVGCVELTVTGSGSATPSGVAFPGYYKNTDPGMLMNIYQTITNYIIPGPAVYKSGSSSSSSSGSSSSGSSSGSTSAPTSRPPTAPTTRPTYAPTNRPTDAPTTRPTDAPNPTSGPSDGSSLKFQVNGQSNIWWFAIATSGGNEDTVKVELKDSGSVPNYYILSSASYGWFFSQSIQLTLPISLRFTSASGKQIVLENYITSYTDASLKDTQKYYGATSTTAPAQKPTGVTLKQHSASSAWWFAIAVNGVDSSAVSSIEIKDSDTVPNYSSLQSTDYGYYIFPTRGSALVAPISVRVTLTSGKQATTTFNSFSGEAQISI